MVVWLSRTMLMRFVAVPGTCRLTVLPCPTLKCEKELNAFAPRSVDVLILVVAPFICTLVSVRPSGTMTLATGPPAKAAPPFSASNNAAAIGCRRGRLDAPAALDAFFLLRIAPPPRPYYVMPCSLLLRDAIPAGWRAAPDCRVK